MPWGAIGAIGGSIASGLFGQKAASDQQSFQKKMSNTAHQRAAKDMEKAGLNRVLAVGSPASTPAGAMATVPDYGSNIATGLSVDMQRKQMQATIKNVRAQTKKTRAEKGAAEVNQEIEQAAWEWLKQPENEVYQKAFYGAYMAQKAGIPTWGGLMAAGSEPLAQTLPPGWGAEHNQKQINMIKNLAKKRKEAFEKKPKQGKSELQKWKDDDWIYKPGERRY